ncbi:hypothetical protein FH972_024856 [Carpinus fangiana]|uniref:Enhancer of polycomb-like protein n=1 Tax=Carpinus fangiana TaxID=176857 RepID=A0A5N6L1T5_9ROSI|nr:hypothetical protein FH972_024856 [Carpinus fangiana]
MRGAAGPAGGSRFRARKLNTKTALTILRESDVAGDIAEHDTHIGTERSDAITSLPKVESGVESKEEREHHLQAVINAARAAATAGANAAQVSIPTPDAVASSISYDKLYPPHFRQPHTYIRFSSTVEDSTGVPYCMNAEDDIFLKAFNTKRQPVQQCSEDEFEQLMSSYEETTAARQPFAAVDNTPVLSLEEMELCFEEHERFLVDERARKFAKDVYEYWKAERGKNLNKSLMPKLKTLKMDSGQEADDSDPYVCFRRREVRQVRKTRGRDAQVVEKLKKLRKELEEARHLLHLVKQREYGRKEDLELSRTIFEQRASVRDMKRTLDIRDDDEDLITQRTPKRRPQDMPNAANRGLNQTRLPGRPDSVSAPEADLISFREVVAQRDREVTKSINGNVLSHERWNRDFIDRTEQQLRAVFSPEDLLMDSDSEEVMPAFVGVKAEYIQQPTPPASVIADSNDEDEASPIVREDANEKIPVRFARPSEQKSFAREPHYRRRTARGGRVVLDRRMPRMAFKENLNDRLVDRFKYDQDDGDDSSDDGVDIYSATGFAFRSQWASGHPRVDPQAQRRVPPATTAGGDGQSGNAAGAR